MLNKLPTDNLIALNRDSGELKGGVSHLYADSELSNLRSPGCFTRDLFSRTWPASACKSLIFRHRVAAAPSAVSANAQCVKLGHHIFEGVDGLAREGHERILLPSDEQRRLP